MLRPRRARATARFMSAVFGRNVGVRARFQRHRVLPQRSRKAQRRQRPRARTTCPPASRHGIVDALARRNDASGARARGDASSEREPARSTVPRSTSASTAGTIHRRLVQEGQTVLGHRRCRAARARRKVHQGPARAGGSGGTAGIRRRRAAFRTGIAGNIRSGRRRGALAADRVRRAEGSRRLSRPSLRSPSRPCPTSPFRP
jgi:hypothetical protein